MSTAPTPPKRDLTLAEVARRLEWKGVCAVGTGFMSALGLILGVTIWILQNTCETKLATAETKLERRQQDVDELRGKLGNAVAEKDAGLARLKEQYRVNAVKNQFLSLCMTYYSAAERHNMLAESQAHTLLASMYKRMFKDGIPNMGRDGYEIQKIPVEQGPVEGFIRFADDDQIKYPLPMGIKKDLLKYLQDHP